jgi:hypothetical protein
LAKWSYGVIDDERLAVLVQVLRLEGTHRAYGERIEHTACITGITPSRPYDADPHVEKIRALHAN